MKKLLVLLGLSALVLSLVSSKPSSTKAAPTLDQQCSINPASGQKNGFISGNNGQYFKPSMNRLTSVQVQLWTNSAYVSQWFYITLHRADNTDITNQLVQKYAGEGAHWYTISGFPEAVVPDQYYVVALVPITGDDQLGWFYKDGCYDRGYAVNNYSNQTYDFEFKTYGYNYSPTPTDSPGTTPAGGSPGGTSGSTVGTGSAPATPTSSIKPPSSLAIADVPEDQGGSLKLNWQASPTTAIDGYKIFRSKSATTGFTSIGTVPKATLDYTDTKAATGETYYYFVRAYKGSAESASSNTVNSASIDNLAPATPKNFRLTAKDASSYNFAWDANTESDLAGYVLNIVDNTKQPATPLEIIQLGKETSYKVVFAKYSSLKTPADYSYSLQAKDIHKNISNPAGPLKPGTQTTAANLISGQNNLLWYILGGIALLILILLIILFYRRRKLSQKKSHSHPAEKEDKEAEEDKKEEKATDEDQEKP